MIPQLRSEWLKLRTMRTTWGLLIASVGMVAFIVVVLSLPLDAAGGESPADAGLTADTVMSFGTNAQLFVLALGILASAGEFRHQTITATLLARPNRLVVISAKTLVCTAAGAFYGLVSGVFAIGGAALLVAFDRVGGRVEGSEAAAMLAGTAGTTAAWAALGVAVGMLVRNQIVALVASIAYIFVIDGLLQLLVPDVWKWLPSGAADAVTSASDAFSEAALDSPWLGAAVLVGWVTVIALSASQVLQRRDVS